MKDLFKEIIHDFHKNELPEGVKRELKIPLQTGKVITITGARRTGKTYLMYQLMKELSKKMKKEQIIYINFEDERIEPKKENLQFILEAYFELYPDNKNLYFFFDEIEKIDGWELFIRRVYDTISKNIFITGSSSKLLVKEIATSLRGRAINYELYPFSFKEVLKFHKVNYKDVYTFKDKARILALFETYVKEGGFPETLTMDNELRKKTLQSYLDSMIYKDIIERYHVQNAALLKLFIKKALSNVAKNFSTNKYYGELKSQGIKISKDTLYEFSGYFQDCYLLFLMPLYNPSLIIQQLQREKKIYAIDTGLVESVSLASFDNRSKLIENIVFLELKRREKEMYYHARNYECDFIIAEKNKITAAIQVTVTLNEDSKEREIHGAREAMNIYRLKESTILTVADKEKEIIYNRKKIKIMPVWKWLLQE